MPSQKTKRPRLELHWYTSRVMNFHNIYCCRTANISIDLGLDGHEIRRENFPLPKLCAILKAAQGNIFNGRGVFVLRGLDPKDYSNPDQILIFLGISSYIAEKRGKQDRMGNVLCKFCSRTKKILSNS